MLYSLEVLNTLSFFGDCSNEARADAGGSHAVQTPRGRPTGEWPPGTKPYFGNPTTSSPFVQCHLPQGFTHQGKKSKSLSFQDEGMPFARGVTRTKQAAIVGVQSWAWAWYQSLNQIQQSSLKETFETAVPERPSKKVKTD